MSADSADDALQLGGSIQLVGFRDFDYGEMVVIKKIVGNYARRFSDRCQDFEQLTIVNKPVHKQEHSEKYEIHGKLVCTGDVVATEVVDHNFFVALDGVLKKLEAAKGDK